MEPVLEQSILTNFFEAYEATESSSTELAMTVKSKGASEDYGWLGQMHGLREMLGERVPQKLKAYKYALPNREFEDSVEVKHSDIKDDQTGKYLTTARSIGQLVKEFPDEQIYGELMPNGENMPCYDGQNFFDTDHPINEETSAVQSNYFTSTPLTAENFAKVRLAMLSFKGDKGKAVNKKLDLRLVVPVQLEAAAKAIVEPENIVVGGVPVKNPNYNAAKVKVSSELTAEKGWYLINVAGEIKPFVIQEREYEPLSFLGENSEKGWWNKKYYFGTYWRGAFGYGLWHRAIKCKG